MLHQKTEAASVIVSEDQARTDMQLETEETKIRSGVAISVAPYVQYSIVPVSCPCFESLLTSHTSETWLRKAKLLPQNRVPHHSRGAVAHVRVAMQSIGALSRFGTSSMLMASMAAVHGLTYGRQNATSLQACMNKKDQRHTLYAKSAPASKSFPPARSMRRTQKRHRSPEKHATQPVLSVLTPNFSG